ncbi:hypothetical protein Hanom_Chr04g00367791 [Helianthus anomalus]
MPRSEQYCFRITPVLAAVEASLRQNCCFFRQPPPDLGFENQNGNDFADVALSSPPRHLVFEFSFRFLDLNKFDMNENRNKLCFFF